MHPGQPLQYPPHYPPSTRWKRFFTGVRGLGPDLAFFDTLRAAQGARAAEFLSGWGDADRQRLASDVGSILATHCNWPSPYFLPEDSFAVIAGGSTFGWADETDVGDAVSALGEYFGTRMPQGFWDEAGSSTLGQVLDQLSTAAGRN